MHCITGLQLIVAFLLAWAHCNSQVTICSCSSFPCITFFEAVQVIQAFQSLAATSGRLTVNKTPQRYLSTFGSSNASLEMFR